jgi:CheY-like chemotaxis protein
VTTAFRILIVEDEPLLAYILEELLCDEGFKIAGVATKLDRALAIIAEGACDAAILDTNLAGVSSGPAASALKARGLPFIVLSGYSSDQLHSDFSGALHLQKPCRPERLIQALRRLLQANAA